MSTEYLKDNIKKICHEHPDLIKHLFVSGYIMTECLLDLNDYPFYGTWTEYTINNLHFYIHPKQNFYYIQNQKISAFLIGHAYNPFTMEFDENVILRRIYENFGRSEFYECINEITGLFVLGIIDHNEILFMNDPSGMQLAFWGYVDGKFCLTSHTQMADDIFDCHKDAFVERLVNYKWYPRVMGAYLPADLSPFLEFKRVVPNHEYTYNFKSKSIKHKRFYPLQNITECRNDEEYKQTIQQAADILKKNMELVINKWHEPWISLTGGIDSNTTFAAANGNYSRIRAFSYVSAPKETIDRDAAEIIANKFHVPWISYTVPETEDTLDRYREKVAIIQHNNAYIAKERPNELRKRVYLESVCPASIEIKSWTSETIRCYWYKHFGRKTMPPLSAKLFRNLYKIFIADRKLAHDIDKIFDKYIIEYEYDKIPEQYPPADMHFNEVTWGSWGSLNIGEMRFYQDITIIYNNRRFLDLLFKVPLEKRISDEHHLDMKEYLNKELYDMHIRIVNMKETKFRAFALNVIFTLNSLLP